MNDDPIGAGLGAPGFELAWTERPWRPRRPLPRGCATVARRPWKGCVWVYYATAADAESGVQGGMGRIFLAAAVMGASFAYGIRDPRDDAEALSPRFGRGAVMSHAMRGLFDSIVVSEPASLGCDVDEARMTLTRLSRHGVGVFSALIGWLGEGDLAR